MGEITREFEQEFAAFIGSKHALAVTNAPPPYIWPVSPRGLALAMRVIVPSLTFVATAENTVRYTGATPSLPILKA